MEKVWEGKIVRWIGPKGGGFDMSSINNNCVTIELPHDIELYGLSGSAVEMRVKEPEPHICGPYRIENRLGVWIATSPNPLCSHPSSAGIMVVTFCPNCAKQLDSDKGVVHPATDVPIPNWWKQ